jgi:alkylation response protein AidB-like acyl-CoA dehydrogenase
VPAENILGGEEAGPQQGLRADDGRARGRPRQRRRRGVGIAQRALELALRYSQERKAFGKPIAEHQAIQFKLADMATQVEAARLLTLRAARLKDAGERSDLEAGMAKLFASEAGATASRRASASTAATATRRSTRSSACTATRRCC